jgi:hypothetical protein
MAKKGSFNLSQTIRDFQKSHRGVSAKDAFDAIKKTNSGHKINEGTFKATFYKLAGNGSRRVKRRKPGRFVAGHGNADHIMRAGITFIRLAGGVEQAREWLVGLDALLETAREVE